MESTAHCSALCAGLVRCVNLGSRVRAQLTRRQPTGHGRLALEQNLAPRCTRVIAGFVERHVLDIELVGARKETRRFKAVLPVALRLGARKDSIKVSGRFMA